MKMQHLRFLVAVVDAGGVGKAADRLRLAQPTVSAGLKALEIELGQPLFERTGGRRLSPTPRALEFCRSATDILQRCDEARRQFRRTDTRPARLRVGVLPTISSQRVGAFVSALAGNEAADRLQLWEGNPSRLADWMRDGRIDACWTTVVEDGRFAKVLWREPFVALVSPKHRFCRESTISLADLDREPIVLRGSCEMPRGRLWSEKVKPRIVARIDRDEMALRLVASGVGLAVAPKSLATKDVVARTIRDLRTVRCIGLKWRPELRDDALRLLIAAVEAGGS
ncbi:MAG: LysR family transcriptional regulator [Rhizobiales bacterium]|nr:LysR family transcriptional regulator [Hyphomicrobiales bacterium]